MLSSRSGAGGDHNIKRSHLSADRPFPCRADFLLAEGAAFLDLDSSRAAVRTASEAS